MLRYNDNIKIIYYKNWYFVISKDIFALNRVSIMI